jgi:hypothetical protein
MASPATFRNDQSTIGACMSDDAVRLQQQDTSRLPVPLTPGGSFWRGVIA